MKKILGIHPLLLALLAIILALNMFDRVRPKSTVIEESSLVTSSQPTSSPVVSNNPVFYNLDKQTDYDIGLFNHKKWYTTNSQDIVNRGNKVSVVAKTILPTPQTVVIKSVTPKPITTKDSLEKPKDANLSAKQASKIPSNPVSIPSNPTTINTPPVTPPIVTPETKLNYIGKYGDKDRQYVFLEVNGNSKAIGLGETVDGQSKLTAIEKNKIQLTDMRTGSSKTITTE